MGSSLRSPLVYSAMSTTIQPGVRIRVRVRVRVRFRVRIRVRVRVGIRG